MADSRNNLLALIRSALWGTLPEGLSKDVDWTKIARIAKQQTLVGLMADGIAKLPAESRPDEKMMQRLQAYLVRNLQAHMLISSRLADTLDILRSAGIEPVLFKGHGLALNYPDPMSRQCGDIDLYIPRAHYDKAVEVCMGHFGKGMHDAESVKHYHLENKGVSVELHRIAETLPGLCANRRYQKWTLMNLENSELRKVDIDGVTVSLPPHGFNAIYVMNHAWHHFVVGGIGLRQICDWTVYLHCFHSQLDHARLEADLKSFGLLKVWHMFAWVAVNKLGLPSEECPLYCGKYAEDAERMLDIIWGDGNFGAYTEGKGVRPEGYSSGKIHSMIVQTKRYFRIMPVHTSHILKSWVLYIYLGVYHYIKGLFR